MRYQQFLDDITLAIQTLGEDELAELAAVVSTAETRILAAVAQNYPPNVKNDVDIGFGSE